MTGAAGRGAGGGAAKAVSRMSLPGGGVPLQIRGQPTLGLGLLGVAALAWWFTLSAPMPVSLPVFLLGWAVMMAAMMLPALVPVVSLYQRAARRGAVAATPVFLTGYLAVWTVAGVPAYAAWLWLQPAVMGEELWVGRLAGGALLVAAVYQVTPWKAACLRGCRSPVTAFTAVRGSLARPRIAVRVGARNGLWCMGCCWALMCVLVAVGVMQPLWMLAISVLIFVEKALAWGPAFSRPLGAALAALGLLLLAQPQLMAVWPG
jgi:predicted metal-binding membrane protein